MKIFFTLLVLLVSITNIFASLGSLTFYHETPIGIIQGEQVTFEVMLTSSNSDLYDMHLFYREVGTGDFKIKRMDRDGYLYHTILNTDQLASGPLEYYIAYEGSLGEIGTLPEQSPQTSPYVMNIAPARKVIQSDPIDIMILSPEPNDVIPNDELVIAASLLGVGADFDIARTKLLIDGTNVTNLIEIKDGVITFSPNQIRTGYHNVELQLYDTQNNLVGQKEWSFRASNGAMAMGKSYFRGSVFLENRYQDILENSDNFFRAGGYFTGRNNDLDYSGRLVYSSEESDTRQPVNRFAAELQYNFSERNNLYLKGGDFTPYYNPLTFYTKRVRGVQTGLAFGFFTFDFIYGQLNRAIEGRFRVDSLATGDPNNPVVTDTLVGYGTFSENVIAFRPGFRFGDNVSWLLNLINTKENKNSIKYGGNLKESIALGTDLNMNFDNRRVQFDGSFQSSINNSNAGLEEVEFDSLAKINEDLQDNDAARRYWDFLKSTGMISMTPGLNPLPSLATRFEATLRYFNNLLNIKYINVDRDFANAANPYLLKDISGIYINDHFRVINNQILINLFYNNFTNNKSRENYRTKNGEFGGTITYLPIQHIPSFTIGYMNLNRANNISPEDTLYVVDNTTSRFTFTATYNVDVTTVKNAFSLNVTNYGRNEAYEFNRDGESDFTLYGLGLRSRFNFPFTTRINYSWSGSTFGSTSKYETDINRFFLGFEYQWLNVFGNDFIRPYLNLILQNTDNKSTTPFISSDFTSKRNHYTMGLAYRNPEVGVLTLRFDQIAYQVPDANSSSRDISDTILNVRYQYNF